MPSPDEGINNQLGSVSCSSFYSCVAVGFYANAEVPEIGPSQTLAEVWNGRAWLVTPSPSPESDAVLDSVSCLSPVSCVAVGDSFNEGGPTHALVELWNGRTWSVLAPPALDNAALNGVACTAWPTRCVAIGNTFTAGGASQTLMESWNGKVWAVVASPVSAGALAGISCTTWANCEVVGSIDESWNGRVWSITPSPNVGGSGPDAVSCIGPTSCVAVGWVGGSTLVESWNGVSWSVTPSPNTGGTDNFLSGVDCAASISCVAVGESLSGSLQQTLVEVGSPQPGPSRHGYR